ncbi:copper resistance CopC family protein [Nonomuraea africana]|uniref:Methionine-rich copper-binding protein CopC n=1 Tax=Nonomuraea africana TaxID=46171 RepID=A0ABR9K853_9ACTN|nr:copper resistance CopC family protein [Nonomuraea africana]MBE1558187.1 methionine-rich copper-binding protein CopC [Nonomuraea africana]
MRRLLTVLLLACAALGLAVTPAQAHNVLTGSDPEEGARLQSAPSQVTLEFDQAVRQGFAQVTVTGPDGGRWEAAQASVSGSKVVTKLRPLGPAGDYVIGYRILSADGHPVSGKVTFALTVAGPGTAASQAPAAQPAAQAGDLSAQAAEAAANGGAGMAIVWVVGALVLLGGGTVVALRRANPGATPARQESAE